MFTLQDLKEERCKRSYKNVVEYQSNFTFQLPYDYSHLSNKREVMLTDFEKNPPSTPRLFQTPRLLILQFLHPLYVSSNLHGY